MMSKNFDRGNVSLELMNSLETFIAAVDQRFVSMQLTSEMDDTVSANLLAFLRNLRLHLRNGDVKAIIGKQRLIHTYVADSMPADAQPEFWKFQRAFDRFVVDNRNH